MQGFEDSHDQKSPRLRVKAIEEGSVATLPLGESPMPSFSAKMHELADDRKQLIFRIRRQLAEKTYDTPAKFDLALERMIDSLGLDGDSGDWLT